MGAHFGVLSREPDVVVGLPLSPLFVSDSGSIHEPFLLTNPRRESATDGCTILYRRV